MGQYFLDQYSLLHFAVGIIFYFFGFSFINTLLIHTLFEVSENTQQGIDIINTYFKNIWPGGKEYSDSLINSIGDTFFTMLGWIIAYYIDELNK